MTRLVIAALATGMVLLQAAAQQKTSTPEALLGAAIHQEEAEGNLEAAIAGYKNFLAQHGSRRALAAQALVRMGRCYEKLGQAEARQAYERVLRDYADQKDAAVEARARLAALGAPITAMTTRQVWTGRQVDVLGSISLDGRYLSFVDWDSGDLAVRDLVTGENRRLTNKGSWKTAGFALFSRISPDGKQVAYNWVNEKGIWELRVGGLDGSGHRVLSSREDDYPSIAGWSPDGQQLLAVSTGKANRIALFSVASGAVRVLKETEGRRPWIPTFSPDGKYVVYECSPQRDSEQRDIYVLALDGGREVHVIEHPADDFVAGWTPDGSRILFVSDRAGTWDTWAIPIADGKPQGPPELVKKGIGRITPLGFTRRGSFYYGIATGLVDVYAATMDFATGKVLMPPKRVVERFIGSNMSADWSPDGRSLVQISGRGPWVTSLEARVLSITSTETGKSRDLAVNLGYPDRPRWSPDGQSILLKGQDRKNTVSGLYLVNAQNGETRFLTRANKVLSPVWSRDGKSILFARLPDTMPKEGERIGQIIARDLETGAEKEIHREAATSFTGDALIHDLAVSPDGRRLAFTADNGRDPKCIRVIPTSGGEPREVFRAAEGEPTFWNFAGLAWTPDGRELIFVRAREQNITTPGNRERELWAVGVEGGKPRPLGLNMVGLRDPRLHPDGKQLAFTAGTNTREVWVMENFLPTR
jgi:Tol biopolymer transport system component